MTVRIQGDIAATSLDGKCVPPGTIRNGIEKEQLESDVQTTLDKADELPSTAGLAHQAVVVNDDGTGFTTAELATLAEALDNATTLVELQAKTRDLHASDYPGDWETADDAKIVVTTAVPPQLRAGGAIGGFLGFCNGNVYANHPEQPA